MIGLRYGTQLANIAAECDRRENALHRLAQCYDTYCHFSEDGQEPTRFADGTIEMDADGSLQQLLDAVVNAIGLPPRR